MLGSPLKDHWINIAEGKVESLSKKPAYASTQYLGEESVVLPAAVNAHAHLELSQLESPFEVPSRSMSDWVARLLAFRRSANYNAAQGIQQAMCRPELLESTIAVADIVPPILPEDLRFVHLPLWLPLIEIIDWKGEMVSEELMGDAFGLSPHAPHTVCPTVLGKVVEQHVPIAMHLAETLEELQLLQHRTGPLLEMMQRADPDYNPHSVLIGKRPMDYLQLLSAAPSVFVIHGNYLDEEELQFLAAHRDTMSVVYCPRSHAYFRHTPYPLKKMLDIGVRVLLGTDSLASTPNLSLVAEIQFVLQHHPTIPVETIYRMGTCEGALALGLPKEYGTLQPGSPARFIVLNRTTTEVPLFGRTCVLHVPSVLPD